MRDADCLSLVGRSVAFGGHTRARGAGVVLIAACLVAGPVLAGEGERVPPVNHAGTAKECGECHMAFQPALLPAANWERIMDTLQDHFGDDARLPDAQAADIRAYLTSHARRRGDTAKLRITEQPWFVREHHFRPEVLKRPEIKTISNCAACHRNAERGIYEDD